MLVNTRVRGLAIKLPDWREEIKKNTRKSKIVVFQFEVNTRTLVESFKKFLKRVNKGLRMNSVQLGCFS
jgi:hypothetical protein